MLGEDITDPFVVYFQAKVRLEGPAVALEECVGSARHIDQSLTVEDGMSVIAGCIIGIDVGVIAVGVGLTEGADVDLSPIAQS
jgi:hypothetical protein